MFLLLAHCSKFFVSIAFGVMGKNCNGAVYLQKFDQKDANL